MSGLFVNASSVSLTQSTTSLNYPYSVGCWVWLTAIGKDARHIFALTDTATSNNYITLNMSSGEVLQVSAAAGGTQRNMPVTTSIAAATWNYVVLRNISSTNRRISVLFHNGNIEHAADTAARAPTSLDSLQIGRLLASSELDASWDGRIAELWYSNGDVQGDPNQNIGNELLRTLAYLGPFSVPYLAPKIYEYLPFRTAVPSDDRYHELDRYWGMGLTRPSWSQGTGGAVTLAPHPPLSAYYRAPTEPLIPLLV